MSPIEPPVTLQPLAPRDAEEIASWARDEIFRRGADWSDAPFSDHLRFQREVIARPPTSLLRLGAWHEDQLIGYVDLYGEEPRRRELGYVIGPSVRWGKGFGTAAARAGLEFGFQELGLDTIWAEALDANPASIRILLRLGMTEIGRGEEDTYFGEPTFYRQFKMNVTDWKRCPSPRAIVPRNALTCCQLG